MGKFSSSLPESESFGCRIARRSCASECPPSRYRPLLGAGVKEHVRTQFCLLALKGGRWESLPNCANTPSLRQLESQHFDRLVPRLIPNLKQAHAAFHRRCNKAFHIPSRSFLTLTFVSANVLSRHKIRSNRAWAATSHRRTRMERVSNLLIEHCERNVRESDKNSDVLRAAA